MTEHIKAWKDEYKTNKWKGYYSLEHLDPYQNAKGRLLDAGCGSGKYTIPLTIRGFEVIAMDSSTKALEMAVEGVARHKKEADFLGSSIENIPFLDETFDVIWCYGVLQHLLLNERKKAINEFYRVLKKGGFLYIEVFGTDDMRYGGIEIEPDTFSRKSGIIYHYFNKNELGEMLKGFSSGIIESKKQKRFNGEIYTRHMISSIATKL